MRLGQSLLYLIFGVLEELKRDVYLFQTPDVEKSVCFAEAEKEEEDISELLAVYPEFSIHKEPIFREMDEAKVTLIANFAH